jgi:hypothetical protein
MSMSNVRMIVIMAEHNSMICMNIYGASGQESVS